MLRRKAMRIILYRGNSRIETVKEQIIDRGYANGFEGLIDTINSLSLSNEVIQQSLRKTVPMCPELAVCELTVNTLIHQDLSHRYRSDGRDTQRSYGDKQPRNIASPPGVTTQDGDGTR